MLRTVMTTKISASHFLKKHPIISAFGGFFVLFCILILFWSWDWFIPLINMRLTALLHRKTTIEHLHISPGFVTTVRVEGLKITQPATFSGEKRPFATAQEITVSFSVIDFIKDRKIHLPVVMLNGADADLITLKNDLNNFTFTEDGKPAQQKSSDSFTLPQIDKLSVTATRLHVVYTPLQADITATIQADPTTQNSRGILHINASGRYAKQPVTATFTGGALLSVMSENNPYPVNLKIQNGETTASLAGQIDQPMTFSGAQLKLHFAGPDMALLYPLTGVPIPHTPAYAITGNLDYNRDKIVFKNFSGQLGTSDIGGTIQLNPRTKPVFVEAALFSKQVNLSDLGGFIGASPDKTAQQKNSDARSDAILPETPINIPKLNAVNAHLTYHGTHIENKNLPLDNIDVDFSVTNGAITLKKLNFGVGSGTIASTASLKPAGKLFDTSARVDFSCIDLGHIMQATVKSKAKGIIGGHMTLTARGNSVASLMAAGNGGLTLILDQGGNITAFLPNLLGLQLANAVMTAIGIPSHTEIHCFITDMPLKNGIASTKALLLETGEARTTGTGTIDFRNNTLNYYLTTRSRGFTIASLPGAFHIYGPIKDPTILPGAEIIGRAAIAAGLGVVFPPLALLPTIQLGVGNKSLCATAVKEVNAAPSSGITTGNLSRSTSTLNKNGITNHQPARRRPPAKSNTMTPAEVRAAWRIKLDQKK